MKKLSLYVFLVLIFFNSSNLKSEIIKFNCKMKVPNGQLVEMEQFFELDSDIGNYDNEFTNSEIKWTIWSPSEAGSDVEGKFMALYHTYNRQNKSLKVIFSQYGEKHKKNEPHLETYKEAKGSCK